MYNLKFQGEKRKLPGGVSVIKLMLEEMSFKGKNLLISWKIIKFPVEIPPAFL